MSFDLSGDTVNLNRGRLPQPHVGCHSCQTPRTDAELVELESARSRWHPAGHSYVFCPGLSHDIRDAESIAGQRELEERITQRMHSLGYFKVVNYYIRHGECEHSRSSLYPDDILRRPLIGDEGKTYRSISIVGRAMESSDTLETDEQAKLALGSSNPRHTSRGLEQLQKAREALWKLRSLGVKMPDIRFVTPTGRTLETDALVFDGLSKIPGSDHPVVIQDLRRTLHTFLPGRALGRTALQSVWPGVIVGEDLPESDEDWQCFATRTRVSRAINTLSEHERRSRGLVRIPMASREDTHSIATSLDAGYNWPHLNGIDQIPLQDNDESPGLLESNHQVLIRTSKGFDLMLDTASAVYEALARKGNVNDTECIEFVLATSSHGRAGSMLRRLQMISTEDPEERERILSALGADAHILDEEERPKLKHLPNAMAARWVTYARPTLGHTRDISLAEAWLAADV